MQTAQRMTGDLVNMPSRLLATLGINSAHTVVSIKLATRQLIVVQTLW